ncbi:helix-turn-helix transcriptional regulator [Paenibacillus planticolens]|uniref:Helix-turn-helix domain-containing protein n=1 Tax=Paenibacillus planticolens TaxID=2654976 RepID=A0ABX1ZMQ5_9BACL|nr:helix-turn-helix transcriptional regulator [Paenibacillus planticolens]NOV01375.1 helix-turn-helix domain-containing protein [Paenibacillus planticolens]
MKLGSKLTDLRNKKHLTQDQMAEILGVKRARYNSWENEIAKPDIEMLKKIAEYHKIKTDDLLDVQQNNNKNEIEIPAWATSKDIRDFKKMLEEDGEVMFDGVPMSETDRQRVMDVLTGLFWEAKQMNKRSKKTNTTDDAKN